ncbi:MAG: DNA starvation/stationary phase protection protein [Bacteroidia bacterium]|nr:DNA starvation/stationary phase protection protein [Bacteroidia bacterium]
MKTTTNKELSNELNSLLANLQVFYANVRGFHWNIKGEKFFELHVKFEELYNNTLLKIDEVAERILTLSGTPNHRFSDYIKVSKIKETSKLSSSNDTVKNVLDGLHLLIKEEKKILRLASKVEDEVTNSLMSDYLKEHEKMAWMYSSFLG